MYITQDIQANITSNIFTQTVIKSVIDRWHKYAEHQYIRRITDYEQTHGLCYWLCLYLAKPRYHYWPTPHHFKKTCKHFRSVMLPLRSVLIAIYEYDRQTDKETNGCYQTHYLPASQWIIKKNPVHSELHPKSVQPVILRDSCCTWYVDWLYRGILCWRFSFENLLCCWNWIIWSITIMVIRWHSSCVCE